MTHDMTHPTDDATDEMTDDLMARFRAAFDSQPLREDGTLDEAEMARDPTLPSFGGDGQ